MQVNTEPEFSELLPPAFEGFPSIARLSRECVVTEKIDGSNAQIFISEDGANIAAGSRNRWITPEADNFGFARWVLEHKTELLALGPGRHFGEWFGSGIQRGYGLKEKRFALFNTRRWADAVIVGDKQAHCPACCTVVPVLYQGKFDTETILHVMDRLRVEGSRISPGYSNPEGIVIYHTAAKALFKRTFEHDETGKPE